MATKTLLTIADYAALEEPVGVRYELNEGELIVTPSADFFHNKKRDRINAQMSAFLERRKLGEVISEMDVQLLRGTVRRPDVAFFLAERLKGINLEKVPLPLAPVSSNRNCLQKRSRRRFKFEGVAISRCRDKSCLAVLSDHTIGLPLPSRQARARSPQRRRRPHLRRARVAARILGLPQ